MKKWKMYIWLTLTILVGIRCGKDDDVPGVKSVDYDELTAYDYSRHVQPLLDYYCVNCHSGSNAAAGLKLDSWENIIAGSDAGETLIAYDAEDSRMIEMLTKLRVNDLLKPHPGNLNKEMPRTDMVNFLKRWIQAGAPDPTGKIPFADASQRLYVCDQEEAKISVIDPGKKVIMRTVDLTQWGYSQTARPHSIAVEPDGAYWYVSLIGADRVLKFDANNHLVDEVTVDTPALVGLHLPSGRLYVSRFMSGHHVPQSIAAIKTADMTLAAEVPVLYSMPHALGIAPNGAFVLTASMDANQLIRINPGTDEVDDFIALGDNKAVLHLDIAPDNRTVYVTCQLSAEVAVVDIVSRSVQFIRTGIGQQPWHVLFNADGSLAYVTNSASSSISIINTATSTVEAVIADNRLAEPHGLILSKDGRRLYVTNRNQTGAYKPRQDFGDNANAGTVITIDTTTRQIIQVLEVEDFASGIALWQGAL